MTFSVTIPAYKSRYLDEAIRSVMAQTFTDWELIIVDDHSPEDLKAIVEPYMTDSRVHYYRNEKNCGAEEVVENWNKCLAYCQGDYVVCMGDDDRLLPCCLEEYSRLMTVYPDMNVYHAKTQLIDESGEVIEHLEERPIFETCQEMLIGQWTNQRKQYIGDFLFSRRWLMEKGGYVKFPFAYCSDWATANLAAKEKGIANGQKLMFEYRDNRLSISRSQKLRVTVTACNSARRWYLDHLREELPSVFESYFQKTITDLLYLDVRHAPLRASVHWITHKRDIYITYSQVIKTCLRGIFASIRKVTV